MKRTSKSSAGTRRRLTLFLLLACLLMLVSLLAPLLCPNDPNATSSLAMNRPPCAEYPFGTDRYGRCVCSRVLMGARTSIFSAVALVGITFAIGGLLGMLSGWYGGVIDALVMRLADVMLAFPQMVLAIAVAGILGGGMGNAMLAMGITSWTLYARLARAQVISLKEEPYVHAARLSGFGGWRILTETLLPNMLGPLLVTAATQIGVIEPQAEWGSMINTSRAYMQLAPWAVLAPAAATIVTVMVFNCLGDCVRDALDAGVEG